MGDTQVWLCARCLGEDPATTRPAEFLVDGTALCRDHAAGGAAAAALAGSAEAGAADGAAGPPDLSGLDTGITSHMR